MDSRFNQYVLEHSWRWVTGRGTAAGFWSPGFFYPVKNVLAYSDNLIGAAPLYWGARCVLGADAAYSVWMMGCGVLSCLAFAFLARRLGVSGVLAAAGALIFGFGLHRSRLINHQQMLPAMWLPLAVLAAVLWSERPTALRWAGLLVCRLMQVLCGVYLGWFSILSVGILMVGLWVGRLRNGTVGVRKLDWLKMVGVAAVVVVIGAAILWPYAGSRRTFGGYPWVAVKEFVPSWRLWLPPWQKSYGPGERLPDSSPTTRLVLPLRGFVFFGCLAAAVVGLWRGRKEPWVIRLGWVSLLVGFLLMALASTWPGGGTAWVWVYRLVPGAQAIRAVSRIDLVVYFFLTLGMVIGVDRLLRDWRRIGRGVAVVIFLGLCLEQWVTGLPSFEVAPYRQQVEQMAELMRGGEAAYLADYFPGDLMGLWTMQVSAMWAGMEADVPVVNGYSGWIPPGYHGMVRVLTPEELRQCWEIQPRRWW